MNTLQNAHLDDDGGSALRALFPHVRYLSLGLVLAWLYLIADYGIWRSGSDPNSMVAIAGCVIFFASSLVTFVASAIMPDRIDALTESRAETPLIALFSISGTATLLLSGPELFPNMLPDTAHGVFFFIGNILCGIVGALVTLQCAKCYCRIEASKVLFYALVSELVVFITFTIVTAYDNFRFTTEGPSIGGAIALLALPPLACLCLNLPDDTVSKNGEAADGEKGLSYDRTSKAIRELMGVSKLETRKINFSASWQLFLAIFVFSATASIVRSCYTAPQLLIDYQATAQITILLRTVLALALLAACVTVLKRVPLEKFFLIASAGIAFGLALMSLIGSPSIVLGMVASVFFFFFDLLIWCLLTFIARSRGYNPVFLFGIGRGLVCAGMLAGLIFVANGAGDYMFTDSKWLSASLTIAVLACSILVLNEKRVTELLEAADGEGIDLHTIFRSAGIPTDETPPKAQHWMQACQIVGNRAKLSPREQEILRQLASNRLPKDTAEYLHISVSTVRTHTRNIYAKLAVHSREELIALVKDEYDKMG